MGSRLPATIPSPPNLEKKLLQNCLDTALMFLLPLPQNKEKVARCRATFFLLPYFFGGLPQIHIKIGMESNEILSQIDKVRKKHALDKILP